MKEAHFFDQSGIRGRLEFLSQGHGTFSTVPPGCSRHRNAAPRAYRERMAEFFLFSFDQERRTVFDSAGMATRFIAAHT